MNLLNSQEITFESSNTPVWELMYVCEPMWALSTIATGASAKKDSVTATHDPSRRLRAIDTLLFHWCSLTTSTGASLMIRSRCATPNDSASLRRWPAYHPSLPAPLRALLGYL